MYSPLQNGVAPNLNEEMRSCGRSSRVLYDTRECYQLDSCIPRFHLFIAQSQLTDSIHSNSATNRRGYCDDTKMVYCKESDQQKGDERMLLDDALAEISQRQFISKIMAGVSLLSIKKPPILLSSSPNMDCSNSNRIGLVEMSRAQGRNSRPEA